MKLEKRSREVTSAHFFLHKRIIIFKVENFKLISSKVDNLAIILFAFYFYIFFFYGFVNPSAKVKLAAGSSSRRFAFCPSYPDAD